MDELPNVDLTDLYDAEPSLRGYFVEGAPINLTENIKPVRKLVNGSPGILDSLVLDASVAALCMCVVRARGAHLSSRHQPPVEKFKCLCVYPKNVHQPWPLALKCCVLLVS